MAVVGPIAVLIGASVAVAAPAASPTAGATPVVPAARAQAKNAASRDVVVGETPFHGWSATFLRNDVAEVVVVPALTRVMRFDLRDRRAVAAAGGAGADAVAGRNARGPFWNHPRLSPDLTPDSDGWTNYGGDKAWPAPQSAWQTVTGRGWPPPRGFDALPSTVSRRGDGVQLVSTIDAHYGIRVRRTIRLAAREPVMTVDTIFEKVRGAPVTVAVWTITQLESPARLFVLLPPAAERGSTPPFTNLLPDAPRDAKVEGDLLGMARDVAAKTMIKTAGQSLLWVGDGPDLLIEDATPAAPRVDTRGWPNEGARSQIYTAPGARGDKASYVELELLGRVHELATGQTARTRTTYTLIPRADSDATAEANRVFAARRR